jgi:hypothetical protein
LALPPPLLVVAGVVTGTVVVVAGTVVGGAVVGGVVVAGAVVAGAVVAGAAVVGADVVAGAAGVVVAVALADVPLLASGELELPHAVMAMAAMTATAAAVPRRRMV